MIVRASLGEVRDGEDEATQKTCGRGFGFSLLPLFLGSCHPESTCQDVETLFNASDDWVLVYIHDLNFRPAVGNDL